MMLKHWMLHMYTRSCEIYRSLNYNMWRFTVILFSVSVCNCVINIRFEQIRFQKGYIVILYIYHIRWGEMYRLRFSNVPRRSDSDVENWHERNNNKKKYIYRYYCVCVCVRQIFEFNIGACLYSGYNMISKYIREERETEAHSARAPAHGRRVDDDK